MVTAARHRDEIAVAIEKVKAIGKVNVTVHNAARHFEPQEILQQRLEAPITENLDSRVSVEFTAFVPDDVSLNPLYHRDTEYHHVKKDSKAIPPNWLATEVKDYISYIKFRTVAQNTRNLNPARGIMGWLEDQGNIVVKKLK
ncbi:hypothetical protein HY638_05715 [Candidatus Woesearchaeota archaeon]|nr:hypothetical protein [Candidatus Woesearchaeota archaeon]